MKTYEYRGYDGQGRGCRGLIEALSVKDARGRLARRNILADRIAATGRRKKFTVSARAVLYHELSALLGAGLPLVRGLDILIDSPDMAEVSGILAGVRDRVREGGSLADAFAEASESTSAFERAIVEVAERSGALETMLGRLGGFLEEQEKIRERVQGALIYPAIVFTVGTCVAIVMLGLLIPRAGALLAGSRAPMPALTEFMIGLGRGVFRWGWLAAAAAALAAVYVRRRVRRSPDARCWWDRKVFALPLLGRGYTLLVLLRFARTLSILLQGGVSVVEGLVLAGRATGSPWVGQLAETEGGAVRHGSSLSEAVRRIPPLAVSLPGWIQVGEASGGLTKLLESAGRRYQDQWDRFVSRSLTVVEPLLILLIGGFVLLVTLSVLLPVISLTHALSN
jgi:type II secretory pathway component PulF